MSDDSEKTEDPTPKKRGDAAKKGQVPKSQEITAFVSILVGFSTLFMTAPYMSRILIDYFFDLYSSIPEKDFNMSNFNSLIIVTLLVVTKMIAWVMGVLMVFGVLIGYVQNRFIIPEESLKFDLNKLNVVEGFKSKFLSLNPVMEMVKGVLKLIFLGYLVYLAFYDRIAVIPNLIWADPSQLPSIFLEFVMIVFWRALIVAVIISVIDYSYQYYKTEESLKMSVQDIKDENKSMEGDPKFKGYRMKRQREIAMNTIKQSVPKADVVVTNPTHFAVALRYRKEEADAPIVLAKGVDFLAHKIRDIAQENDVAIVENAPLARGLYYKTREGQMIAPEFFTAVAEILATIYKRRREKFKKENPYPVGQPTSGDIGGLQM